MASRELMTMESTRNYEQILCIESMLVEVVIFQCIKYIFNTFLVAGFMNLEKDLEKIKELLKDVKYLTLDQITSFLDWSSKKKKDNKDRRAHV